MDSLLASYASSDEEDERSQQQTPREQLKEDLVPKSTGFLSSLPPPKSSSSFFSSLPPPRIQTPISSTSPTPNPQNLNGERGREGEEQHLQGNPGNPRFSAPLPKPSSSLFSSLPQPKASSSSSLFSTLPAPKTQNNDPQILPDSSSVASRKVVQFRPPTMNPPANFGSDDEDDDDEDEREKQKKKSESLVQTSSVKSFLSSIPKPKNSTTLGALPSASGLGRRSMLEADVLASNDSDIADARTGRAPDADGEKAADNQVSVNSMIDPSDSSQFVPTGDYSSWGAESRNYVNYEGYTGVTTEGYSNWGGEAVDYANYDSNNGNYTSYGQYENNWVDGSNTSAIPQVSGPTESVLRLPGKRGRKDTPPEIVEVKQDELMKNRPREDQVKLTGIAFGPSYQPASTKGKPSKLHKRKHQIGSLYFDMRQKEMELAERRSKGLLTKAQTQGKYGW